MAASLEPICRRPDVVQRIWRMPQVGKHPDAPVLEGRRLRVLVLVDHVLVERLRDQQARLRLHPGRHEGRDVQSRVAVESELVVDDLVRGARVHRVFGHPVPRCVSDFAAPRELRADGDVGVRVGIQILRWGAIEAPFRASRG